MKNPYTRNLFLFGHVAMVTTGKGGKMAFLSFFETPLRVMETIWSFQIKRKILNEKKNHLMSFNNIT